MKGAYQLGALVLVLEFCMGMASAQQFTIKRSKLTVVVESDENCHHGISVSRDRQDGGQLCADYPEGVVNDLQKYAGSTVEVEALWTFLGDGKSNIPVALDKVYKIGPAVESLNIRWEDQPRK